MKQITRAVLQEYRQYTFRLQPDHRLKSPEVALDYIQERGYILFWPCRGIEFPSLWTAVAGNRPVADEHDDPGHITWGWKDEWLGKHLVYYGRVIRRKNTFISLDLLPYFYALSPNYGNPYEDYLIDYTAGKLSAEAKAVYEALIKEGALDTLSLRKAARLASRSSDSAFNRALEELQITFRIVPVGVAQAGAWKYAFIYDLTARHFPNLIEDAHPISEWDARRVIVQKAIQSLGAVQLSDLGRLFPWEKPLLERTCLTLVERDVIAGQISIDASQPDYFCVPDLLKI
ncbi:MULTISPECIES: hypothetical protein [Anaerolinea]|uniref:AlkZ-related protein n=1 Tax=Anaerolinea TaxID=233189 RepID=UPI00263304D4|nr:hypothetical protein [Anaerolinea thermophila]